MALSRRFGGGLIPRVSEMQSQRDLTRIGALIGFHPSINLCPARIWQPIETYTTYAALVCLRRCIDGRARLGVL